MADKWWQWMFDMSWQVSILIVIVGAFCFFYKKSSSRIFYYLWLIVFIKLITPPQIGHNYSISSLIHNLNIKSSQQSQMGSSIQSNFKNPAQISTDFVINKKMPVPDAIVTVSPKSAEDIKSPTLKIPPISYQQLFLILWALGIVVILLRTFISLNKFHRLLFTIGQKTPQWLMENLASLSKEIGLRRTPECYILPEWNSLCVFGWFKPKLIIPDDLLKKLTQEQFQMAIYHELFHIKRRDIIMNGVQSLIQMIYWFHPLVWIASREIRHHREMIVDESVVNTFDSLPPKSYEETILTLSENNNINPVPAVVGIFEPRSYIFRRIVHLLETTSFVGKRRFSLLNWLILAIFTVFFVPMGMSQPKDDEMKVEKKSFPEVLSESQRLYMEWTDKTFFAAFLDQREFEDLLDSTKADLEKKWIGTLEGPWSKKYYQAINCLATIKSKNAGEVLLKIAAERREKDNRDRWMAVRALGIISYEKAIPELIHLVYYPNQNTRFWAQISLARITGVNFGTDWEKWGNWWSEQGKEPPFSPQKVQWASNPQWMDPQVQQEADKKFIEKLKGEKRETPSTTPLPPEEKSQKESKESEELKSQPRLESDSLKSAEILRETLLKKAEQLDNEVKSMVEHLTKEQEDLQKKRKYLQEDLHKIAEELKNKAGEETRKKVMDLQDELLKEAEKLKAEMSGDVNLHKMIEDLQKEMKVLQEDLLKEVEKLQKQANSDAQKTVQDLKQLLKEVEQINYKPKNMIEQLNKDTAASQKEIEALQEEFLKKFEELKNQNNVKEQSDKESKDLNIDPEKSDEKEGKIEVITGKDLSLYGIVTDKSGKPISDVKIMNWAPFGSNQQETLTDKDGKFYFEKNWGYVVIAKKDGYAPAFCEFRDKFLDEKPGKGPPDSKITFLRFKLTLTKGGTVEGKIVSIIDNKPIEDAKVWVERWAVDPDVGLNRYIIWTSEPASTGKKGNFAFNNVPPGTLRIRSTADGFSENTSPDFIFDDKDKKAVTLVLAPKTQEEISKEKAKKEVDLSLSGTVTDASGKPIDGVDISNFYPHGSNPQSTFTDSQGKFYFNRERGYVVIAKKNGFAPTFYEFKDELNKLRGKPINIKIVLTEGGIVEGVISSMADNKPIANAKVWVERWAKDEDVGCNRYVIWKSEPVQSDEKGKYRIINVPSGASRICSKAESFAENKSTEFALNDKEEKNIPLQLYEGVKLILTIIDNETNKPIAGALVKIIEVAENSSDRDGKCVFNNMSKGSYFIMIAASGYHDIWERDYKIEDQKGTKEVLIKMVKKSVQK